MERKLQPKSSPIPGRAKPAAGR